MKPSTLTTQQLSDLMEEQVFEMVKSGAWSLDDFTDWSNAVRSVTYSDGRLDGKYYLLKAGY